MVHIIRQSVSEDLLEKHPEHRIPFFFFFYNGVIDTLQCKTRAPRPSLKDT